MKKYEDGEEHVVKVNQPHTKEVNRSSITDETYQENKKKEEKSNNIPRSGEIQQVTNSTSVKNDL